MRRIPYGDEKRPDWAETDTCPDCGCEKGEIHRDGCNYHPRPTSKRGWKRMAAQNQKWRKFERRHPKLRKMERECADVRH